MGILFSHFQVCKVLSQRPQQVPALGATGVGESYLMPAPQCPQAFHDDSGAPEVRGRPVCWMADALNPFLILTLLFLEIHPAFAVSAACLWHLVWLNAYMGDGCFLCTIAQTPPVHVQEVTQQDPTFPPNRRTEHALVRASMCSHTQKHIDAPWVRSPTIHLLPAPVFLDASQCTLHSSLVLLRASSFCRDQS